MEQTQRILGPRREKCFSSEARVCGAGVLVALDELPALPDLTMPLLGGMRERRDNRRQWASPTYLQADSAELTFPN